MFKVINNQTGYTVMNGINSKSRIFVANRYDGGIHPYHILEAITFGDCKENSITYALLESDRFGEEDCVIVRLPLNGQLKMVIREDRHVWRDTGSQVAYLFDIKDVEVLCSYNGLDDLEDVTSFEVKNGQLWTQDEINNK